MDCTYLIYLHESVSQLKFAAKTGLFGNFGLDVPYTRWKRVVDVNATSVIHVVSRHFVKLLIQIFIIRYNQGMGSHAYGIEVEQAA